jgi:HlyD family secretion protein
VKQLLRLPSVRIGIVLVAVILLVGFGWYMITPGRNAHASVSRGDDTKVGGPVLVEVIQPQQGGIRRVCNQPGTVEPFEAADLYAKASGYLVEQSVDIGSKVKKGDILARISVPEYEKQVQRDQARVRDAEAKIKQMEAHLVAAKADAKAADATIGLSKVLVRAKTSFRQYREKQLERVKELAREKAIEPKVVDEDQDFYLSALESENAAKEGVNAAEERAAAAHARITQAEADVDAAQADLGVVTAELEKSKVLLDYTVIKSPFAGVVTKRAFHLGDFIKAADQGGMMPLLRVEQTAVMRVVVQVPDRDVPYIHAGAPAVLEIDALPGVVFESTSDNKVVVSRWADAEDPASRTMRTEVDVPNADGALKHGMYGRLTLILSEGNPKALRIPSSALIGKSDGGRGVVRILNGETVHLVPIRYATDNGVEAEIVSGLSASDLVIVRAHGAIEEDTAAKASGR